MMVTIGRRLAVIVLLVTAGACATVDFDYPKTGSYAPTDTAETYLGRRVADYTGENEGKSGFYIIPDGVDAMAIRIAIAERAERTLDVMYYLINADKAGYLIIQEVIEAAERGVRVRVLLDDVLTKGYDRGHAGPGRSSEHPDKNLQPVRPAISPGTEFPRRFRAPQQTDAQQGVCRG